MYLIDKILDGRYEVEVELGRGGMGTVYKGLDKELNRPVAIKVMSAEALSSKEAKNRFKREMKTYARLSHHNIVQVYSFGTLQTEQPFIVLEFVDGDTLGELIFDEGALRLEWVKSILGQIASALDYIHGNKLVHRDLKPENIMVIPQEENPPGRIVLMDFGLVKTVDGTVLTKTGAILGTPLYMPPEQAIGETMTALGDIYQMGLIAYEMLTGARAFDGETIKEVLGKVISEEPPPLREFLPLISQNWQDFIDKCIAKNPDKRFQSAKEVLRVLDTLPPDGKRSSHLGKRKAVEMAVTEELKRAGGKSTRRVPPLSNVAVAGKKSPVSLWVFLLLFLMVPIILFWPRGKNSNVHFWTRCVPDEVVSPSLGSRQIVYHFLAHNGEPKKDHGYVLPGPKGTEKPIRLNDFRFPECPKPSWLGQDFIYYSRLDKGAFCRHYAIETISTKGEEARCYIVVRSENDPRLTVEPKWNSIRTTQVDLTLSFFLSKGKARGDSIDIIAGPKKGEVKNIRVKDCKWQGNSAKVIITIDSNAAAGPYVFQGQAQHSKAQTIVYLCHDLKWPKTVAILPGPTKAVLSFISAKKTLSFRWKVKRDGVVIKEAAFTHDGGAGTIRIRGLKPEHEYEALLTDGNETWQRTFVTEPILFHRPVFSCAHKGQLYVDYDCNLEKSLELKREAKSGDRINWQLSHDEKVLVKGQTLANGQRQSIPLVIDEKLSRFRHPKFGEFLYFQNSFVFADGFGIVCCEANRFIGDGGKVEPLKLLWVYRPPNMHESELMSRPVGGLTKLNGQTLLYTYCDKEDRMFVGILNVEKRKKLWQDLGGPTEFQPLPKWVEGTSSSWQEPIKKFEWRAHCKGLNNYRILENGLHHSDLILWQTVEMRSRSFGFACYELKKAKLLWNKQFNPEIDDLPFSKERTSKYEREIKWEKDYSVHYLDSPVKLKDMAYSLQRSRRADVGYERDCLFIQCPLTKSEPTTAKLLEAFPSVSLEQSLTVDEERKSLWFVGRDHLYRWHTDRAICQGLNMSNFFPRGYNSSGLFLQGKKLMFVRWHLGPESSTLLPFQRDVMLPRPHLYTMEEVAPGKTKVVVYGPQLFVNQSSFPGYVHRLMVHGRYLILNGRHNLAALDLETFRLGTMTPAEGKIRTQGIDSFGIMVVALEGNSLFTIPVEFLNEQNSITLRPMMTKVIDSNILSSRSTK